MKENSNLEKKTDKKVKVPVMPWLIGSLAVVMFGAILTFFLVDIQTVMKDPDDIFKATVGIVFFLGLPLTFFFWVNYDHELELLLTEKKRSALTSGRILEAGIEESVWDAIRYYNPYVTCEFKIGDRNFSITISSPAWSTDRDKAVQNFYSPGDRVSIHYDPDDPDDFGVATEVVNKTRIGLFVILYCIGCAAIGHAIYAFVLLILGRIIG